MAFTSTACGRRRAWWRPAWRDLCTRRISFPRTECWSRWALAHKRLKKQIYSALLERSHIEHAVLPARLDARRSGRLSAVRQPRPDRHHSQRHCAPGSRGPFRVSRAFSGPARQADDPVSRSTAFQERTRHSGAGLERDRCWFSSDAVLVLAGPEDAETRVALAASLQQADMAQADKAQPGISSRVVFTGMLAQEMKWSALGAGLLFHAALVFRRPERGGARSSGHGGTGAHLGSLQPAGGAAGQRRLGDPATLADLKARSRRC